MLDVRRRQKATLVESFDNYFDSRPVYSGIVFLSGLVTLIILCWVIGG